MRVAIIGFLFLPILSSGANASALFEDNFDDPTISQAWVVKQEFNGWTTTDGAGIEIQTNGAVGGTTAHSGNQYIELDSDTSRGGVAGKGTNSKMTRSFAYGPGRYNLEFYYLPRTNAENDNAINVWWSASDESVSENIGTVDGLRSRFDDWALQSFTFDVLTSQTSWYLSLSAGGTANELGGFIDTLSLYRVSGTPQSIPTPATGFLMVAGLICIGFMASRRRPTVNPIRD